MTRVDHDPAPGPGGARRARGLAHAPIPDAPASDAPIAGAVHRARTPHPALAGTVRSMVGYDLAVHPAAVHLGVPSTGIQLVFSFEHAQRIAPADGRGPGDRVRSFVAGLYDELVTITADHFHGVQLELTPLGALRLFGPLADLRRRSFDLDEVLGPAGRHLEDRVAHADGWEQRFDLVEAALLARLDRAAPVRPELGVVADRLARTGGRLPVQALAAELAWSRRHLSASVTRAFGLPPKRFAQLVRMEHVTRSLDAGRDLATVAAEAGFSDQAHLTNEVRAFTGLTPGQLRARRFPEGWYELAPAAAVDGSHPSKTAAGPPA